jgi:hypothetical protein
MQYFLTPFLRTSKNPVMKPSEKSQMGLRRTPPDHPERGSCGRLILRILAKFTLGATPAPLFRQFHRISSGVKPVAPVLTGQERPEG